MPVRPRRRLRSYKIQEVTKRRQVLLVQVVKEERGTKGAARGLEQADIAALLEISVPTVKRDLRFARAWLTRAMGEFGDD